jgi:hypothetical protein
MSGISVKILHFPSYDFLTFYFTYKTGQYSYNCLDVHTVLFIGYLATVFSSCIHYNLIRLFCRHFVTAPDI